MDKEMVMDNAKRQELDDCYQPQIVLEDTESPLGSVWVIDFGDETPSPIFKTKEDAEAWLAEKESHD